MHKAKARFTTHSPESRSMWKKHAADTRKRFRQPLATFTPGQMSSEMALASGGTIYIGPVEDFSHTSLKHTAYLAKHMSRETRPYIVLAFKGNPEDNASFIAKHFEPIECPP